MFGRLHGHTPIQGEIAYAAVGTLLLVVLLCPVPITCSSIIVGSLMLAVILRQASGSKVTLRLAAKPISRERF